MAICNENLSFIIKSTKKSFPRWFIANSRKNIALIDKNAPVVAELLANRKTFFMRDFRELKKSKEIISSFHQNKI